MSFGIDYAWSRPTIRDMKAAGVEFVARYTSHDTTGKDMSRTEAEDLTAAGFWLVLVWETTASRALAGRQAGRDDALSALHRAAQLGMPEDRPIFFAVDFDARERHRPAIREYFRGVETELPRARTGMYGGYDPIKWAFDDGFISYGWQTYAWSGGKWDPRAGIQQYQNGMNIGGHTVDYNRSTHPDYGQWRIGESPMALSDADKTWLTKTFQPAVAKAVWKTDGIIPAADDNPENTHWAPAFHIESLGRILRKVATAVAGLGSDDVDEQAIIAGVLSGLSGEAIAAAIKDGLGDAVANDVLDSLRNRLES